MLRHAKSTYLCNLTGWQEAWHLAVSHESILSRHQSQKCSSSIHDIGEKTHLKSLKDRDMISPKQNLICWCVVVADASHKTEQIDVYMGGAEPME